MDKSIKNHLRNNDKLLDLVMKVISDEKKYPKRFVQLCYDIHEEDTDTAEDEKTARDNNLKPPGSFIKELSKIKLKYLEFWKIN